MSLVLSCERKRIEPIRTMCFDWWKCMCLTREWERERSKPNNEHWWFSRRSWIYDVRYTWVMLLPKKWMQSFPKLPQRTCIFIRYGYAIRWLGWLVHVFFFDSKIVSYFLLIIFPFIARKMWGYLFLSLRFVLYVFWLIGNNQTHTSPTEDAHTIVFIRSNLLRKMPLHMCVQSFKRNEQKLNRTNSNDKLNVVKHSMWHVRLCPQLQTYFMLREMDEVFVSSLQLTRWHWLRTYQTAALAQHFTHVIFWFINSSKLLIFGVHSKHLLTHTHTHFQSTISIWRFSIFFVAMKKQQLSSDKFKLIHFLNFIVGFCKRSEGEREKKNSQSAKSSIAKFILFAIRCFLQNVCAVYAGFLLFRHVIVKFNLIYSHFICVSAII